uniref:Uncharacterized protein n=1 Tax=Anopheles atroparvus TaxID=41427 RepID=A0AAG5DR65_ANOAO
MALAVQDGHVVGGQASLRLYPDQQRGAAARHHALAREVLRLEGERERALELLDHLLDQLTERVVRMLLPQVVDELRDRLRVGVRLERVPAQLEELLDVLVVRHDAVVHHDERVRVVRALRVRVELARGAVRGPAGVRDADVRLARLAEVDRFGRLADGVLQHLHLAGALEQQDAGVGRDPVNGDARRVVATVLEPLQPVQQQLQHVAARLRREEVEVRENSAHSVHTIAKPTDPRKSRPDLNCNQQSTANTYGQSLLGEELDCIAAIYFVFFFSLPAFFLRLLTNGCSRADDDG